MIMEILISALLFFVGITALVVVHVYIVRMAFGGDDRLVQGNVGGGNKRMSNEDLKKLPCFEYEIEEAEKGSDGSTSTSTSSPVDCVVCLENLSVGDKCRLLPNCRHIFHAECIDSWLLKTPICPICRGSVGGVSSDDVVGIEMT